MRKIEKTRLRSVCALSLLAALATLFPKYVAAQQPSTSGREAQTTRALYERGLAMAQNGKTDDAIAAFRQALAVSPRDKLVLNAAGAAYSIKGDLLAARNLFLRSIDADPNFAAARQNLAISYYSLGDYEYAQLQFKILEQQSGPTQISSLFLGMIAARGSDCRMSSMLLKRSGPLLYRYPEAVLAYANCAYQGGDKDEAEKMLKFFDRMSGASAAQRRDAVSLHNQLGHRTFLNLELGKSLPTEETDHREWDQALAAEKPSAPHGMQGLDPANAEADKLMQVARSAKEHGDIAGALKSLRRVSQIAPDREDSYLEYSTICADHDSDALALQAVEIGLEHLPHSYRLTLQRGVVLDKLGRLKDAEASLRSAEVLSGDTSIAMLSLAIVLLHQGKPQDAEKILAEAIRKYPDNFYMHYLRGKLLVQSAADDPGSKDVKSLAQHSLEEAIRLNPQYADSYYQLATLYEESSTTRAEEALSTCLKLDPHHIPAQYALARLYVRTGRRPEGQALIARLKTQQRTEEMAQQKQLRIEAAQD